MGDGVDGDNKPFDALGRSAAGISHHSVAKPTEFTNTRNTPIEPLERAFPLRVLRYRLRQGSGGAGAAPGGGASSVTSRCWGTRRCR